MNLSLGIVGLPNVGKSTLFNALTQNQVPAENYPFNTIDPNVGVVPVQDPRLTQLAELIQPNKVTPAVVEFWDIAGLVKGAATGEGLGNKFLANIRNVNAIVHVVRAFQSTTITHVENSVDPTRDLELINTELILKDLETVAARIGQLEGKAKADPKMRPIVEDLQQLQSHLSGGLLAKDFKSEFPEESASLFLLTAKPVIYIVNSEESKAEENAARLRELVSEDSLVIGMDIKLEAELAELGESERVEYLQELGLTEPALARLTREAYALLGLISFFTAGETEVRAWTIKKGSTAPQAAGTIHTDFQKHFITSEVVKFDDFISTGGWTGSKEKGAMRLGGKDYIVQDGDVMLFKHNA